MDNSIKITLIVVSVVFLLGIASLITLSDIATPNEDIINVNGESSISVIPDRVGIYFTVKTTSDNSSQAASENARIVQEVTSSLMDEGLEKEEIETLEYSIREEYDWTNSKRELDGYTAIQSLKVELSTNDSERIGKILDAGISSGAQISHINYELSREFENEYKAEAIAQATKDANTKAESVAKGINKKLGKVVSYNYNPRMYRDFSGVEAGQDVEKVVTDIQPSEKEITASVRATYKIK